MARFLYNLILMSISGSIMYLLALIVKRTTRDKFSGWYYALSVTAAMLLIVPLQAVFTVPKIINIEISHDFTQTVQSTDTAAEAGISAVMVIFAIWLAVTAVSFAVMLARYIRTARNLKAISDEAYDETILSAYSETRRILGVSRDIKIMTSDALSSPLLFGIFKPSIVIPSRDFTYDELKMIFAHELTHYRHKDLTIKLIASLAASVHWFNPLTRFLVKSVNEYCELCCDESVLKRLNLSDKKDYGRLIISVIEHTPSRRFAYSTAMASPKHGVQKRLLRIAEFRRTSGVFKVFGVMAVVSMAICSMTAFGFSEAKEIMPEPIAEFIDEAVTAPTITAEPAETTEMVSVSTDAPIEQNAKSDSSVDYSHELQPQTVSEKQPISISDEMADYENTALSEADFTGVVSVDEAPIDDTSVESQGSTALEKGANREDCHAVLGTPVSADGTKETYTLENGNTAVIKYDGDIIYDMYIVESTE